MKLINYLANLRYDRSEHGEAVVEPLPPPPLRHQILRRLAVRLLRSALPDLAVQTYIAVRVDVNRIADLRILHFEAADSAFQSAIEKRRFAAAAPAAAHGGGGVVVVDRHWRQIVPVVEGAEFR